jgi:hypothetical protein
MNYILVVEWFLFVTFFHFLILCGLVLLYYLAPSFLIFSCHWLSLVSSLIRFKIESGGLGHVIAPAQLGSSRQGPVLYTAELA